MFNLANVFVVVKIHPTESGVHQVICGKFALTSSEFHVLEDHCGWLSQLERKPIEEICRFFRNLSRSHRMAVYSLEDYRAGHAPDLLPEEHLPTHTPIRMQYTLVDETGGEQTLQFAGDKVFLDDFELSPDEVKILLDRAHTKQLTVLKKAEEEFGMELLAKGDALTDALKALNQGVKSGQIHPDHLRAVQKEIYSDSMVPGVGNKKAYNDFLSRNPKGVFVHVDGNSFGQINKKYGFEAGNGAIKAYGDAMRNAMDATVGRSKGKVHRAGGDEFMAYVPSHEDALHFAIALRQKLSEIPAIGGKHQLSASVGIGHSPQHAEKALIAAKTTTKSYKAKPGQELTHIHAVTPESEGAVAPPPRPPSVLGRVASFLKKPFQG